MTTPSTQQNASELLATELRDLFQETGMTLSVMESCTGGLLASCLTDVPKSGYLLGGAIAYDPAIKRRFGVPGNLIDGYGVVSREVAQAMAHSAARWFNTDVAASITGVAGPAPQEGCPPGTFFVAVWSSMRGYVVRSSEIDEDREGVKAVAARTAMELLAQEMRAIRGQGLAPGRCTRTEAWIG
jgi:nicotinamide-nucleotide amidase